MMAALGMPLALGHFDSAHAGCHIGPAHKGKETTEKRKMNRPHFARTPHRLARLRSVPPPRLLLSPRPLLQSVLTASLLAGLSLSSLPPAARLTSATRRPAPAAASTYLHTDGARLEAASGR